jgi:hypothetical protein
VSAPKITPTPGGEGKVELPQMTNLPKADELSTREEAALWAQAVEILERHRIFVDKERDHALS